jgi:uncharacterized membrane protein
LWNPPAAPRPSTRREHLLDLVFLIGVMLKGLDGLVEVLVAVPLLTVPHPGWVRLAHAFTAPGLRHDPIGPIAGIAAHEAARLTREELIAIGVYLGVHGAVKLAIVIALLVGATRVYPWAIGALGLLTVYQVIDLAIRPSLGVAALTALDVAIIMLTWREWRRNRTLRTAARDTWDWLRRRS